MTEAVDSVDDFQPMFEASREAQRGVHAVIALFDSAVCDSTKSAIAKYSIYDGPGPLRVYCRLRDVQGARRKIERE